MRFRVALDRESIVNREGIDKPNGNYVSVVGNAEETVFDDADKLCQLLDEDHFFDETYGVGGFLWDWGDVDHVSPALAGPLSEWLEDRLKRELPEELKHVYRVMLDYARKTIELDTVMVCEF